MSHRYKSWFDVAALDEHLTVFLKLDEALERFLGDSASFSREPYKISTDSGSVERSSRAQISDAVDSLGGSAGTILAGNVGEVAKLPAALHVFVAGSYSSALAR